MSHRSVFEEDQREVLPIIATKERCQGGTFIVTGSNTGLGYEAAKHFVQLSPVKVILAVRSISKGEEAKSKIEAETGVKGVAEVWPLDMGSFESIKTFAKKVNELDRLDAIIENAAIALDKWSTSDGMETTMIVNVVGTMFLAGLVMPKLQETAKKFGILPHLSLVGSGVAFTAAGELEKIDGDIIDWLNDESHGLESRYPVSKLILLYAFREYASLKPLSKTGVVINYVNPGLCYSDLNRHVKQETKAQIDALRALHGRTAEMGSRTLLHGALGGEETHGKYLSECKIKEHYIASWVTDESGQRVQKRVWESVSAHVNKVSPGCL